METRPLPHAIRLLTYLSPGLPLDLFGAVADHLRRCPGLGRRGITLASEERVSGPERSSVGRSEDPFSRGEADVGFLCAATYLALRERERPPAELLGVAPVFADERTRGEPVYFCDVIVRRGFPAGSFRELEGVHLGLQRPVLLERLRRAVGEAGFAGGGRAVLRSDYPLGIPPGLRRAGGRRRGGRREHRLERPEDPAGANPVPREEVRVLESWGPYPIQPVVVRASLDPALKSALRESLLNTEADPLSRPELGAFGLERFVAVGEEDYDVGRLPRP
jgi:phosphonate transport system substrate-binding protein